MVSILCPMEQDTGLDRFIWRTYPKPNPVNDTERMAACRAFWESVAREGRVALLIEVLSRYRSCRQRPNPHNLNEEYYRRESFALNELIATGYRMRIRPTEQESLAILRTAYHTCAHGSDVRPPVDLALRHFRRNPYSQEFFEALRCYRATLGQSPPTRAQELKGRIDLILWQDVAGPWKSCWTTRIRAGVLKMPPERRKRWTDLFQRFYFTYRSSLPDKPASLLDLSLGQLTVDEFSREICKWVAEPPSKALTGTGCHVVKNLIWCAIHADRPELDLALTTLVETPWKGRYVAGRIARSLLHLWGQRDEDCRQPHVVRICRAYPDVTEH
jgi:hypothetical protein